MDGPIDLDALVLTACMASWGQPVTFMPRSGLPQEGITARFEEKFREAIFIDGNEIATGKPVLGAQASQFLQQPQKEDTFEIQGRLWRVIVVLPDGNGHLHIRLDLANDAQVAVPVIPPQLFSGI
jgi:hypothetical protein